MTFDIPKAGKVKLAVFDLLGREVSVLVNGYRIAGRYSTTWDAAGLPTGVYFYRLETGSFTSVRKMLLAR
jgi:hypothetical protein